MKTGSRLTRGFSAFGLFGFACASLFATALVTSAAAQDAAVKVEIEINNTAAPTDDYLTWAPTPARIRLAAPAANPVTVTLTNDPEQPIPPGRDQPLDGNVAFAQKVLAGETATLQTLALTLPSNGNWVPFVVAGSFPRASAADKDAVIEIHLGDANGPKIGSQATMVRVRKNIDKLTPGERDAFLKALHDLHVEKKTYEDFPRIHDLAAKGKRPFQQIQLPDGTLNPNYWPDQAHQGSAFLPWHRAFLLLFERRLQAINPAVTLPYWRVNVETKAFDPMFLGTNKRAFDAFQTEVIFSPANWLYGWNISYQDLKTVIRAPKDTSLLRLPSGKTLIGDTELFGTTPIHPTYVEFHAGGGGVEMNPHNFGHGLLGAWHNNCLISPSDPSFWPFHAEHDRLWAKWQWFHGRFDAEGKNKDSYDYIGAFIPNDEVNSTDLGHNLKDTMWPWDGTKGRVLDDKNSRANHPTENPFPAFPASAATGLWPAAEAKPKPADMIDYLGLSGTRLPHGVAYDDVPYGVQLMRTTQPVADASSSISGVLADIARDNAVSPERRVASLSLLQGTRHAQADVIFRSVASDAAAPPQVRRQASINLIEADMPKGMDAVLGLVEAGGQTAEILTPSVIETAPLGHHSKLPNDTHMRMHHILTRAATNPRDPQAVSAAIVLTEMLDPDAPKYLTSLLKSDNIKGADRARAVAALPLATAGVALTLREVLEKAMREGDTDTALAVIRALANDQQTRAFRLQLAGSTDADETLVRAAMRSLMHETPDLIPSLLTRLEGVAMTDAKMESAGAFRVTVESFKPFPRAQVDDWKKKIQASMDGETGTQPATLRFKAALLMTLNVLDGAAK